MWNTCPLLAVNSLKLSKEFDNTTYKPLGGVGRCELLLHMLVVRGKGAQPKPVTDLASVISCY